MTEAPPTPQVEPKPSAAAASSPLALLRNPALMLSVGILLGALVGAFALQVARVTPLKKTLEQRDSALRAAHAEVATLQEEAKELEAKGPQSEQALATLQGMVQKLEKQRKDLQDQVRREEGRRREAERAAAGPVIALTDGKNPIYVRDDGTGIRVLSSERLPQTALEAVRSGEVSTGLPQELFAEAPTVEGGKPVTLTAPFGTALRTATPTLRWEAVTDANRYAVTLIDETAEKRQEFPGLTGTEWTPRQPLERGHRYQWTVRAFKDDTLLAEGPQGPAPTARFQVLDSTAETALDAELMAQGESPLLRGLVLARVGLMNEAEAELKRLADSNSGSTVARNLLESVQKRRRAAGR